MPADLGQRRVAGVHHAQFGVGLIAVTRSHHEDFLGAQVDRGADGRQMPHRPVAAPLGVAVDQHCLRRKDERDGRRGQQMVHPDGGRHRLAQGTAPGLDAAARLVEGEVFARAVARGRDGQRIEQPRIQIVAQLLEIQVLVKQHAQRLIVEQ